MGLRIKFSIIIVSILFLVLLFSSLTIADVPNQTNFQGYLTDKSGTPLHGDVSLTFILWDSPAEGNDLWAETQTVNVDNGVYNAILGQSSSNGLTPDLFENGLYLGVTVGTDTEMEPRLKLTSTPFASRSAVAEIALNAVMLDGQDSIAFDQSAHLTRSDNPHNVTAIQVGALTESNLNSHTSNESAHHTKIISFTELTDQVSDAQIPDTITVNYAATAGDADTLDNQHASDFANASLEATVTALQSNVTTLQSTITAQQTQINSLVNLLQHFNLNGDNIYITGANLHIRSGAGTTDGTVNGLGNLVVGYNEDRSYNNDRTGSHNIIVGKQNNYSSYGGLVAGYNNTIAGNYSSISGGYQNTASGDRSSVSGGRGNLASGNYSSVSGGYGNAASNSYSSVSGGYTNIASGNSSSISGGYGNAASNSYSSVSGGGNGAASGYNSSISGGYGNAASGFASFIGGGGGATEDGNIAFADYSVVLGGIRNIAGDPNLTDHTIGTHSSVSGGYINTASGESSSVSGGFINKASGDYSSVSGGSQNAANGSSSSASGGRGANASGDYSSFSGGNGGTASGYSSSISGGISITASGDYSSISGGYINTASGSYSSVSGGVGNNASGSSSSISGGYQNTASGNNSSVNGGYTNEASGDYSSVSGGSTGSVTGTYNWRAGGLFEEQ